MPLYGFRERPVAETLRDMAHERLRSPAYFEPYGEPTAGPASGGSAGVAPKRGKPKADIAGGADGTMIVWDSSGATTEEVEVTNPYTITLDTLTWCRAEPVDGWAKSIIEPDYWSECTAPPDNVQGPIGS